MIKKNLYFYFWLLTIIVIANFPFFSKASYYYSITIKEYLNRIKNRNQELKEMGNINQDQKDSFNKSIEEIEALIQDTLKEESLTEEKKRNLKYKIKQKLKTTIESIKKRKKKPASLHSPEVSFSDNLKELKRFIKEVPKEIKEEVPKEIKEEIRRKREKEEWRRELEIKARSVDLQIARPIENSMNLQFNKMINQQNGITELLSLGRNIFFPYGEQYRTQLNKIPSDKRKNLTKSYHTLSDKIYSAIIIIQTALKKSNNIITDANDLKNQAKVRASKKQLLLETIIDELVSAIEEKEIEIERLLKTAENAYSIIQQVATDETEQLNDEIKKIMLEEASENRKKIRDNNNPLALMLAQNIAKNKKQVMDKEQKKIIKALEEREELRRKELRRKELRREEEELLQMLEEGPTEEEIARQIQARQRRQSATRGATFGLRALGGLSNFWQPGQSLFKTHPY